MAFIARSKQLPICSTIFVITLTLLVAADCVHNFLNPKFDLLIKDSICTILDPELVFNATCHDRRVNQTANHSGWDVYLMPGLILDELYVIAITVHARLHTSEPSFHGQTGSLFFLKRESVLGSAYNNILVVKRHFMYL